VALTVEVGWPLSSDRSDASKRDDDEPAAQQLVETCLDCRGRDPDLKWRTLPRSRGGERPPNRVIVPWIAKA
jgi:hypothetical protein